MLTTSSRSSRSTEGTATGAADTTAATTIGISSNSQTSEELLDKRTA